MLSHVYPVSFLSDLSELNVNFTLMYKNIGIAVLILMVIAEGGYILKLRNDRSALRNLQVAKITGSPRPQQPQMLTSGMKLSDSPIAKFAYKVAPGTMDDSAKAALVGWSISSVTNKDKSTTVTFTPKNADDQKQVYIVKPGSNLYFVEMSAGDDHADTDEDSNLRDDYGILVDASGMVE